MQVYIIHFYSQYDCRKTPSGGIPKEENSPKPDKTEEQEEEVDETTKPVNNDESDLADAQTKPEPNNNNNDNKKRRKGNGFGLSPKWCRNCDARHSSGKDGCPFNRANLVVTDSVIDFSTNKSNDKETNR